jgi:hypothetical protein
MNCQYCDTLCLTISETYHRCLSCKTNYLFGYHLIYCNFNQHTYTIQRHNDIHKEISVWGRDSKPLLKLPPKTNITPQNAKEKLKTYLIFL